MIEAVMWWRGNLAVWGVGLIPVSDVTLTK